MTDLSASSATSTFPFMLGSQNVINTSTPGGGYTTTLPLTLRTISSWGVPDVYIYGTFAPNVPGATNGLFLHTVPLGWYDLYSYSGSVSNAFSDGLIGSSFMLDVAPGTYTLQDAPLFPGDAFIYGAWFSPASGQSASSLGTSNGVSNTTTMILIENLAAIGSSALSLRTATISAATGERPEGRGCDSSGCVAPAVPVSIVCGSGPATAILTRLNPTAMWQILLPPSAGGAAVMAKISTCSTAEASELGVYRSMPYAQFFYGANVTSGALASASMQVDYTGQTPAQVCQDLGMRAWSSFKRSPFWLCSPAGRCWSNSLRVSLCTSLLGWHAEVRGQ